MTRKDGFVARHGLWTAAAEEAAGPLREALTTGRIDVLRLCFVDQHGLLRGKALTRDAALAALDDGHGIVSTLLLKDTAHRTVFEIWGADAGFGAGKMTGAGDIIMVPDPTTFHLLPWSPGHGMVLCDLSDHDGTPFPLSTRGLMRALVDRLAADGMALQIGLEVEFYVFRLEDAHLVPSGSTIPQRAPEVGLVHHGYQYLTDQHYDQMAPLLDDIRRQVEEMGLPVRSLESEFGPSQCEVTFDHRPGLEHADGMAIFRNAVKQICRRRGYHATFMCQPGLANMMPSGWHVHQSLTRLSDGQNLFAPEAGEGVLSQTGQHYLAGLLKHASAASFFSTPTINGYARYQGQKLAPDAIQWGVENRGAMLRVITGTHPRATRIENRAGEPAANPYLYLGAQIASGLDGIAGGLTPPPAVETPYAGNAPRLPQSLEEAMASAAASALFREAFGASFMDYLVHLKSAELRRFRASVTDWEHQEYFTLF